MRYGSILLIFFGFFFFEKFYFSLKHCFISQSNNEHSPYERNSFNVLNLIHQYINDVTYPYVDAGRERERERRRKEETKTTKGR